MTSSTIPDSWTTSFFEEFHRPGISLETVNVFRAEYTYRMWKWKWEEHQLRYLHLRRMRLRRPLGALRKQMSTLRDPIPQVVPVNVDTEELKRIAYWYKSSSSQRREPSMAGGEAGEFAQAS